MHPLLNGVSDFDSIHSEHWNALYLHLHQKKSASPPHTKEILKVEDKYQQWMMIDTGTVWKNWTATCLCKVTGFHLQVLREVGNVFVRPFSIILEKKILGKSCMNGERKVLCPLSQKARSPSGKPLTHQSQFSARENHGASSFRKLFWTHKEDEDNSDSVKLLSMNQNTATVSWIETCLNSCFRGLWSEHQSPTGGQLLVVCNSH